MRIAFIFSLFLYTNYGYPAEAGSREWPAPISSGVTCQSDIFFTWPGCNNFDLRGCADEWDNAHNGDHWEIFFKPVGRDHIRFTYIKNGDARVKHLQYGMQYEFRFPSEQRWRRIRCDFFN